MIYDCFTFFNELDLLEVRLNELSGVVDKFVLVEATKTFQGDPKPLHFHDNKRRFAAFSDQIIHIVVEFPEDLPNQFSRKFSKAWLREFYQRDQISVGLKDAKPDDLVIVSDVDEIIRAQNLKDAVASRSPNDLTIFGMAFFNGFVDRKQSDLQWLLGPRMIKYKHFTGAQKLRLSKAFASRLWRGSFVNQLHTRVWNALNCRLFNPITVVENSGWHLTSLGGWDAWRTKINSFSHEEGKLEERYRSEEAFTQHILDTTSAAGLEELPLFIQTNPSQFPFFGK